MEKKEFIETLQNLGELFSPHPEDSNDEPYPVVPFPGMSRKTVEELDRAICKALREVWRCWCGEPAVGERLILQPSGVEGEVLRTLIPLCRDCFEHTM